MSIIKDDTIKLLNDQLNKELFSASFYFNMSSWCDKHGLKAAVNFYTDIIGKSLSILRSLKIL